MSMEHIERLRNELPDLFDIRVVPEGPRWGLCP